MALLNENRNRIPLIAVAPVDGTPGIRGQMRMIETAGDTTMHVCTVTDEVVVSTGALTIGAGTNTDVVYTAVAVGNSGNLITAEHVDSVNNLEPLAVVVVGNAITVTLETDVSSVVVSTAGEVAVAILANINASALVTVVASGDGLGVASVASVANLVGGGLAANSIWKTMPLV